MGPLILRRLLELLCCIMATMATCSAVALQLCPSLKSQLRPRARQLGLWAHGLWSQVVVGVLVCFCCALALEAGGMAAGCKLNEK